MVLLIGYNSKAVIRQEDGKIMLSIEDSEEAPGCFLVTAEGQGDEAANYTAKHRKAVYIGRRGGITTAPKKKGEETTTTRCPYTIPIPFPEQGAAATKE